MTSHEKFDYAILQQILEEQGYIVVGYDTDVPNGCVLDAFQNPASLENEELKTVVISRATGPDLVAQQRKYLSHIMELPDDVVSDWLYHYKVIAE